MYCDGNKIITIVETDLTGNAYSDKQAVIYEFCHPAEKCK
jgi:hypothetical protein